MNIEHEVTLIDARLALLCVCNLAGKRERRRVSALSLLSLWSRGLGAVNVGQQKAHG